ncbi:hypothetical protein [Sorlinia euscelidii]
MADYTKCEFSSEEINGAGDVLASRPSWTEDNDALIRSAFNVAYSWRDAHIFPMRSVHGSVSSVCSKLGVKAVSGARVKRMPTIYEKLPRVGISLYDLQDLVGCRFIFEHSDDLDRVRAHLKNEYSCLIDRENDYIKRPKKATGYRSHHMIFRFARDDQPQYNDYRVEVQLRTRIQHAWSTAVEAIGLYRSESLKSSQGDGEWLEFLRLISSEMALMEGKPPVKDGFERANRIERIRQLYRELNAGVTLNGIKRMADGITVPPEQKRDVEAYLLIFDIGRKEFDLRPFRGFLPASTQYRELEMDLLKNKLSQQNVVLIEAKKLDNIKRAFPNYFSDIAMFDKLLDGIIDGRSEETYKRVISQAPVNVYRQTPIDPGWMRKAHVPRPVSRSDK